MFLYFNYRTKILLLLFYQVWLKWLLFWLNSSEILFHDRRKFYFKFYFTKFPKNLYFYFTKFDKTVFYSDALILKSYFILLLNNEFDFYSTKFNNKLFYFDTHSLNYNLFSRTSVESTNKLTISTKFLKHCHPLTLIQTKKNYVKYQHLHPLFLFFPPSRGLP